eukprot:13390104-Heterocapsa_arctica.AAC.1
MWDVGSRVAAAAPSRNNVLRLPPQLQNSLSARPLDPEGTIALSSSLPSPILLFICLIRRFAAAAPSRNNVLRLRPQLQNSLSVRPLDPEGTTAL